MLLHNDKQGKLIASLVDPELFEGDYGIIAEKAVDYWQRYGYAPKDAAGDLVADILEAGDSRSRLYEEILRATVALADQINEKYVLDQLRAFVKVQRVKRAIMRSAERINAQAEMAVDEVEAIWNELLRQRDEIGFERGLSLADYGKVLDYLEAQQLEFPTGIKEFDKAHIGPARGTVLLFLGPSGRGKSWFCVHVGKMALRQGKRVLHISLEMSQEQVAQRYYQSLFNASKREPESEGTVFRYSDDRKPEFRPPGKVTVYSEFILRGQYSRDELEVRLNAMGARAVDNLIIKRFPSLTMDAFEAYLDGLENDGWIPDMVILDYWGLVDTGVSMRDYRLGTGAAFKRFRAIMIERNMAGVTPQQVTRKGIEASFSRMTHVGEDISLPQTADVVLNYSSTDEEHRRNLGRVYVSKGRDEKDRFGVVLNQHYETGQFVVESDYIPGRYFDMLPKDDEDEDDERDGEDGERDRWGSSSRNRSRGS